MTAVRAVLASCKPYLKIHWLEIYGSGFVLSAMFFFLVGFFVGGWLGVEISDDILENPGQAAGMILRAHPESDYVRIRLYKNGKWYRGHGAGHNDHVEPIEDSWAPIGWKPDEIRN